MEASDFVAKVGDVLKRTISSEAERTKVARALLFTLESAMCNLDDEDRRAILVRTAGVCSPLELDTAGFSEVMRFFEELRAFAAQPGTRRNYRPPCVRRLRSVG